MITNIYVSIVNGQPFGYLNLTNPTQVSMLYITNAYPARTPNLGPIPIYVYAPTAWAVAHHNTDNLFTIEYQFQHNENNMDQALLPWHGQNPRSS